jgi:uncharacterized protein DUF6527
MKAKSNSISYKGTIEYRGQSNDLLSRPGEFVIVKRGVPRLIIMRCPCGCGDDLLINLDPRSGDAWRLYKKSSKFSLYPSYWRDTACGSHFILWNSRIHWCYQHSEYLQDREVTAEIENTILQELSDNRYIHFLELADKLNLIPWECLQTCELLVKKGLAKKNKDSRYEFSKKKDGDIGM